MRPRADDSRARRARSIRFGTQNIDSSIARLFTDPLVEVDAHGNFVPDLAVAVQTLANRGISADGLTIRYNLRRHVTWQDGSPFSSTDVRFTYDAIMNADNDVDEFHGYDIVKSVETPAADTVVFPLKERFAPFVATVLAVAAVTVSSPSICLRGTSRSMMCLTIPCRSAPDRSGSCAGCAAIKSNSSATTTTFAGKPNLRSIVAFASAANTKP